MSVAAALLTLTGVAAAQSSDTVTIIPALYASTPMTRNANGLFAAAVLSTSALDRGMNAMGVRRLPPRSARARVVRMSKFALFDVPVVMYFVGLNHEFGHITRADEQGFRSSFSLVGTPWSGRPFQLLGLDARIFDDAGSQVGGVGASSRLKRLGEELMAGVARVPSGHALATVAAALDLPLYAARNLSPGTFDLTLPDGGSPDGDAARFAAILARDERAGDFDSVRGDLRRRSMINLADYGLWTLTYGLVRDHLWKGEGGVRVRWLRVGSVGVIPSLRYEWSPIGPEIFAGTRFQYASRTGAAYVRWTDGLAAERLVGAGFSVTDRRLHHVTPGLAFDVWSHGSGGRGIHGAITAEARNWPARRAALSLTIGAKSSGYLAAYPRRAGAYANAGFVVRLR